MAPGHSRHTPSPRHTRVATTRITDHRSKETLS